MELPNTGSLARSLFFTFTGRENTSSIDFSLPPLPFYDETHNSRTDARTPDFESWGSRSRRTPAQAPTIQYDFLIFFFLEIKKRQKILYNLPLSPAILLSLLSPPHSARVLHLETKTLWKECVLCTQCVYRPDSISWSSKLYLASFFFFLRSLFYSE